MPAIRPRRAVVLPHAVCRCRLAASRGWACALRFPRRTLTDADIASLVDGLCRPVDGTAAADRLALGPEHLLDRRAQPAALPLPGDAAALAPRCSACMRARCGPDRAIAGPGMRHERHALHPPLQGGHGMTPGSYRLNLRINGARRLLATGAALSEAAYAMGFADQAHLQRAFKAHHALTPGCYARGA
ncbi:Beta-enolase [Manis javanica]|nr:Beta-enolase [Manis javanica]